MYTRTFVLACIGLLGLIATPGTGTAQEAMVPQLINYQGTLTGPDGKPPATGDYTLSFSIYESPMGQSACSPAQMQFPNLYNCGRRVWGPQVFDGKSDMVGHGAKVPVVKGFFNVLLGPHDTDGDPIALAFTAADRFVEVTVVGDGPVLPRQQVFSAPYALRSLGETPVGGIIMFSGLERELPENWKVCNGQEVTDSDSPFFGEMVPDLRGMFIRGAKNIHEVANIGGRDKRDNHNHTVSVSVKIERDSLKNAITRHLLCTDDDRNDRDNWNCDHTGLHFGVASNNAILSDPGYRALVHKRGGVDSHGHDTEEKVHVSWDERTSLDNRPRHMNLHYIIRIK